MLFLLKKRNMSLKTKFFMVGIKINPILLYEMKKQWYKKYICEFQLLNFTPIFLKVLEVGHSKNAINKLEAQLLHEIILSSFF